MGKTFVSLICCAACAALVASAAACRRGEPTPEEARRTPSARAESRPAVVRKTQLPVSYELVKTIEIDMASASGVAIDGEDRLYVAGARGIRVLDGAGQALRAIKTARPAVAVALDGRGNVYAALRNGVEVFNPNGERIASWGEEGKGPGQMRVVTAIAVSEANVYVADAGNRCVHRFDTTGDFINEIGKKDRDSGVPGIIVRQAPVLDIAVDSNGILHVANPGRLRVERYKPDGTLLDYWGRSGRRLEDFCGCCNPTNILLLDDGRIATSEKSIPRVKVYDKDRKLLALIASGHFSKKAVGLDMARDSKKRIYVLDPVGRKIKVFARKR